MTQCAVGPRVSQVWPGGGSVLLANQDITNPVTIGRHNNISIASSDGDVLPALGAIAYTGDKALYAIAPAGTAAMLVIPGGGSWAPSPAQVALQIATLGLAQDTSVQAVKTTLGAPAQNSTVAAVTSAVSALQPAMQSVSLLRSGAGITTMQTFAANSRIWALFLSFAAATNNVYVAGTITNLFAQLVTGSGLAFCPIELTVSGPTQAVNQGAPPVFTSGLPVNSGDTLQLNVNNGAALANGAMRASCTALYSTP